MKVNEGWRDCGWEIYPDETPPDIMLNFRKIYDERIETEFGTCYVGLVVRENSSKESICQRLPKIMKNGKAYLLTIYMCNSLYFNANSRTRGEIADFSKPACLVLYGSNDDGDFELLRTGPINHHTWKKYTLLIQPQKDFHTIILEADFEDEIFTYNGHLFLDNISDLEEVNAAEYDKISIE